MAPDDVLDAQPIGRIVHGETVNHPPAEFGQVRILPCAREPQTQSGTEILRSEIGQPGDAAGGFQHRLLVERHGMSLRRGHRRPLLGRQDGIRQVVDVDPKAHFPSGMYLLHCDHLY